jgi:hypothetical protein
MRTVVCDHLNLITAAPHRRLRGLPGDRREVGAPAALHDVRARRLLRELTVPSCAVALRDGRSPVIQSFESNEDWLWCYIDRVMFELPALSPSPSHR